VFEIHYGISQGQLLSHSNLLGCGLLQQASQKLNIWSLLVEDLVEVILPLTKIYQEAVVRVDFAQQLHIQ
jgi:hypothetical protein